jgi:hypothetical protein
MPALEARIIQGLSEASVLLRRDGVPTHEIVEAFAVSKFSHSYFDLPVSPGLQSQGRS